MAVDASYDKAAVFENMRGLAHGNLGIPILLLVILAMMTLPMPPFLLDLFFTFNITIAYSCINSCRVIVKKHAWSTNLRRKLYGT